MGLRGSLQIKYDPYLKSFMEVILLSLICKFDVWKDPSDGFGRGLLYGRDDDNDDDDNDDDNSKANVEDEGEDQRDNNDNRPPNC